MVQYRPRKESARNAPRRGSIEDVPVHALIEAAAEAFDCPSGPVRYDIKFDAIP
jgi:hypothetical protein